MPHDKYGNRLQVGDRVLVTCRVADIYTTDEYCNIGLETIEPMYPGTWHNGITLNGRQIEKVFGPETAHPDPLPADAEA